MRLALRHFSPLRIKNKVWWTKPIVAVLMAYYCLVDLDNLDYGQILSEFGALKAPHIIGIGPLGQKWRCLHIQARLKAMRLIYGGPPSDFIPYGRLVYLNPKFVR